MKPDIFSSKATGRLAPLIGVQGLTHAFVPEPLPPAWKWPNRLWPLLLEAHKALSNLDGTGKHLPNPELLIRPLQHREAQKSSSLEGTFTDPHQQLLFELDPQLPSSTDDPANARREISNYTRALRLRRDSQSDLPLSLRLIRRLHAILMDGVRGADRNPGQFRRTQNQIGRPARFVPSPVTELPPLLDRFEKYLHEEKRFDPLVEAFLVHYQFETIHPFLDGNGRVGRLLLSIVIEEWCGLSHQWLYMSAYFDRNRDEYIDRMLRVSTHGAWEEWVDFCLRGVVEQAHDTVRRCERLIELNRRFHEQIKTIGGSVRLAQIVDSLFISPVVIVSLAARQHNVSYPTARTDLRRLEDAGILHGIAEAQQISYFCPPIFDVIYDD